MVLVFVPTDATDDTVTTGPSDFVLVGGGVDKSGSQAPGPMGPPSWAITVGCVLR